MAYNQYANCLNLKLLKKSAEAFQSTDPVFEIDTRSTPPIRRKKTKKNQTK